MLAATVAHNFGRHYHHLIPDGMDEREDQAMVAAVTSPEYQQLLLSTRGFSVAQPSYQMISPSSATQQQQQQQPTITLSRHHTQPPLFTSSEMTYLGQTLIPSGYPVQQTAYHQSSPASSFNNSSSSFDNRQLQAWPQQHNQQQQQTPSPSSAEVAVAAAQRHFFDEYQQQSLQAGSRSSLSSDRASIDLSTQQQQQQHLQQQQASVYTQLSPTQHHSPQSDYMFGLSQQQQHHHHSHHHHHSLPTQSPGSNLYNSDYGESSSREREQGGAPNMVGSEGMPEPAPRPKGPKLKFTRADDALLIELKEGKNLTWKQIADFFPGRSSGTLQVRYCTKLKAKTTVWTEDMVQRLRNAMAEYEQDRWRIISSKVGNGFSSSACQDKALELEIEEAGDSFLVGDIDDEDDYSSNTQQQ